jgi:cytochrome c oxidase cbb3-type subunit 3
MPDRRWGVAGALLLAATICAGQAGGGGKPSQPEAQPTAATQKPKTGADALAALLGGPQVDAAAAERGRKIFVPTCGFCHGSDAHGKSGPDLVRSALVLHDKNGDLIGAVLRTGRPDRGMPAFPSFTPAQVADIAAFLHSLAAEVTNRFAYKIGDIVTGNPQQGDAFFNGAGHCSQCHSPTGDLAHIASKYDPVELQRRMLYPAPSFLDLFLGKAAAPAAPTLVTVRLASGERIAGTLDHLDEFNVAMHDAAGWPHSFSRRDVTLQVKDPRAEHVALLPLYTDADMHNLLAYLETLQ